MGGRGGRLRERERGGGNERRGKREKRIGK